MERVAAFIFQVEQEDIVQGNGRYFRVIRLKLQVIKAILRLEPHMRDLRHSQ